MKKSKKVLLWSIVPVLGVSSGVAGAVAGTKDQTTSVGTNNVATSSSATTMAARNTSSNLKIESQTRDVIAYSKWSSSESVFVNVGGVTHGNVLRYTWKINKGNGWQLQGSSGVGRLFIDVPETTKMLNWTVRCEVTDIKSGWKAVSEDIKFTITPWEGRYVDVTTQPDTNKVVSAGDEVVLKSEAKIIGNYYQDKTIGYQWFEYNSENDEFTLIQGADKSEYRFTAPYYSETTTKKYLCRYYFTDNKTKYISESNHSTVTVNKGEEEKITIEDLKASETSINVGEKTTLSVKATSNATKDLTYQWFKVGSDDHTFEKIEGATTPTYIYEAVPADNNKALIFCVLVSGTVQNGVQNHFQSGNLEVKVGLSSETTGSVDYGALAEDLKVSSSVTTNQASVRSNFYLNKGIKSPEYTVSTSGAQGLSYQWYYVGRNGIENLIDGANTNVFKPTADLLKKVYNDNSNHKVDIVCKISKDGKLIKTVDKTTNSRFYLGVVINNRRVSNI